MVRQAREMIANGAIGKVRVVQDFKQAEWRTDPKRSGAGGSTGDIGTHAFNLACFVSGLSVESLAADLQSFVPGRQVDDNAHVMLRFNNGARGMLWSSQVAPGNENALREFRPVIPKVIWKVLPTFTAKPLKRLWLRALEAKPRAKCCTPPFKMGLRVCNLYRLALNPQPTMRLGRYLNINECSILTVELITGWTNPSLFANTPVMFSFDIAL